MLVATRTATNFSRCALVIIAHIFLQPTAPILGRNDPAPETGASRTRSPPAIAEADFREKVGDWHAVESYAGHMPDPIDALGPQDR